MARFQVINLHHCCFESKSTFITKICKVKWSTSFQWGGRYFIVFFAELLLALSFMLRRILIFFSLPAFKRKTQREGHFDKRLGAECVCALECRTDAEGSVVRGQGWMCRRNSAEGSTQTSRQLKAASLFDVTSC